MSEISPCFFCFFPPFGFTKARASTTCLLLDRMFVCITLPPPGSIRGAGQEESTLLNEACLKDADRVFSTAREASPEGLNQAKWVQDTDVTRTKPAQQQGAVSFFPSARIGIPAEALKGGVVCNHRRVSAKSVCFLLQESNTNSSSTA